MKKILKYPKRLLSPYIITLAEKIGFEYSARSTPVNFINLTDDAEDALKRSVNRPVIINCPIELLRGHPPIGFKMSAEAGHPHILEALAYINSWSKTPLKDYYRNVQPLRASDLMGINSVNNNSKILQYSVQEAVRPWRSVPGIQTSKNRKKWLKDDIIERDGSNHQLAKEAQGYWFMSGPVPQDWIEFERKRIEDIVDSIQKHGYQWNHSWDSLIQTELLVGDVESCLLILKGQHRAVAMAALDFNKIPILVKPKIVRRNEVGDWPAVVAKSMTKHEALQVFDRIISGNVPEKINSEWIQKVVRQSYVN